MKSVLFAAVAAASVLAGPAAAQETKSEACKLLTAEDAAKILGHTVMNADDSPDDGGMMSCGWVDEETFNAIVLVVHSGAMLGGVDPGMVIDSSKEAAGGVGTVEDVPDIGDKAYLHNQGGEGDSLSLAFDFAKSGKVVSVRTTGVPKEGVIEAATIIAGRL